MGSPDAYSTSSFSYSGKYLVWSCVDSELATTLARRVPTHFFPMGVNIGSVEGLQDHSDVIMIHTHMLNPKRLIWPVCSMQ
jgi:hypothetical protein